MDSVPLPRSPGIYQITCIPTGKIYVGSSVNLRRRCNQHIRPLNNGTHKNHHLQSAWSKYGADAFEFNVLELCEQSQLIDREQHYLDVLRPFDHAIGFNITRQAGSTLGFIFEGEALERLRASRRDEGFRKKIADMQRGRKASEETLEKKRGRKLSEEHKAKLRNYKPSAEARAKISAASKNQKHTKETRAKISAANKGQVFSPESRARMSAARKGRKASEETRAKMRARRPSEATRARMSAAHMGRTPSEETLAKIRNSRKPVSRHIVTHIASGERFTVHLPTFCKEHGLSYGCMIHVVGGRYKQHRGYHAERIPKP